MFLGIDLGTSSVKAVVIDENDRIAAQASSPLGVQRPQPLWSEQNPEEWWHASVEAVRALPADIRKAYLKNFDAFRARIRGICEKYQAHYVLADTGKSLALPGHPASMRGRTH